MRWLRDRFGCLLMNEKDYFDGSLACLGFAPAATAWRGEAYATLFSFDTKWSRRDAGGAWVGSSREPMSVYARRRFV